jgi:hypothetical protein
MCAWEISASGFVEKGFGVVVAETPSYLTRTSYILNTSLTTFLFTQYSPATPTCTAKDLRLLSFVPVYRHVLSFPVCFSRWGIENFYMVFPYSVNETVTKTEIFHRLSKNA